MAVDKVMQPSPILDIELEDVPALEVEVINPDNASVEVMEDGSVTVEFGSEGPDLPDEAMEHDANLAEFLEDSELESLASDLIDGFNMDRRSRKDWAESYINGLELLGMKVEERMEPWDGASGVFHPMLSEAVVRFQAQAMGELMPAAGPAKTKIMGKLTREKLEQAQRVEQELNYQITERIPSYREEQEQLLFKLPLAGSAFKKVYFDPNMNRPRAVFVPAEDFVVSYGASSLDDCPRYTHVMKRTPNEIRKLQVSGLYRDIELPEPLREVTDIEEAYAKITGVEIPSEQEERHTLLEMNVDLSLPAPFADPDGIDRPYVVTIDLSSRKILAIYRNWYEDDETKTKRSHFSHYPYLPGMGFYGTGLTHLIGGLTKSATSILRQLIDAGTLSNLPAGLKSRALRIKGDTSPLRPGEWRDVDVVGGTLRDSLFPMPYKEPSTVLYQLLGNVVQEGRRISSMADLQAGDMNSQAPVGTTLALLERNMKVLSGIQHRLHAAMRQELRLLARVIRDFMGPKYDYSDMEDFDRVADFGSGVNIIPVSDPNAATAAQRIMQYQAALQLSQQAPQLYDMGKLHRQMLEVLGIQDASEIISLPDEIKPKDPVAENMAILNQTPVKAFLYQDHEAHIAVHMAAAQDPKLMQIVGQSPFAGAIKNAMAAHITEHVAMAYRKQLEQQLGVPLPGEDEPLPEDIELELSRLTAQAAGKLLQKNQAEAAAQQAQQEAQNPLTQIQLKELEIKEAKVQSDAALRQKELELAALKAADASELQRERLASEERREGARLGVRVAGDLVEASRQDKNEGVRMGIDIAKQMAAPKPAPKPGDKPK
jgi:hypothetical protein